MPEGDLADQGRHRRNGRQDHGVAGKQPLDARRLGVDHRPFELGPAQDVFDARDQRWIDGGGIFQGHAIAFEAVESERGLIMAE
ncbi:hypothetical protein D9M68_929150 [compost metagenome]